MSDCFTGEIRIFGGSFAPQDWAFCDGTMLTISQNPVLFALIGNAYGGDGVNNFALPDLRGRVPVHAGADYPLGQMAGWESVTLNAAQIPAHAHGVRASSAPGSHNTPAGKVWAAAPARRYTANTPNLAMKSAAVGLSGANAAHENMMPFLVLNFIICLFGNYPPRS
jgi:microcystin-dependent protein